LVELPLSSNSASGLVQDLRLDVLVFGDVNMDSLTTSISRKRLAVTQVSFWGHPFTSGSSNIEYFVGSSHYFVLNAGNMNHTHQFSEQVVLFDSLNFLMYPPKLRGDSVKNDRTQFLLWLHEIGKDAYGKPFRKRNLESLYPADVRIYGCHQSLMKMHPLFDLALEAILKMDPFAVIILSFSPRQRLWQDFLARRLSQEKADTWWHRLLFVDQMSHDLYIRLVCGCDVTLDPFPFGGGVTLVDSLSCPWTSHSSSVPFVTSAHLQSVLRLGSGMEYNIVEESRVKTNENENATLLYHIAKYATSAVRLARNLENDVSFSKGSVWHHLYENDEVVEEWETFLLRIAQN